MALYLTRREVYNSVVSMDVSISRVAEDIKEGERVVKILRGELPALPFTVTKETQQNAPGPWIKIYDRDYSVDGISATWTVIKPGDGASILPILEMDGKRYFVLEYKPDPSISQWLLELPAGGVKKGEGSEVTAKRELAEETGYAAQNLALFMSGMHSAPWRLDHTEDVYIATNLVRGERNLEYEEQPIKVCAIPVDTVAALLRENRIQDMRVVAVISSYLLQHGTGAAGLLRKGEGQAA